MFLGSLAMWGHFDKYDLASWQKLLSDVTIVVKKLMIHDIIQWLFVSLKIVWSDHSS